MATRKKNKNQPALFMHSHDDTTPPPLEPTPNDLDEVFKEEPETEVEVVTPEPKPATAPPAKPSATTAPPPPDVPALNIGDISAHWKIIKHKLSTTEAALAHLLEQPINSDEEDEALAKELVLANNTLKVVENQRKEITTSLDLAKKEFMKPEKRIKELFDEGRKLRDRWLNEKLRRQEEERKKIQEKKDHDDELITVKAALDCAVVNGMVGAIKDMNVQIEKYVQTMTPANWQEKAKRFDLEPKLNPDKYHAFFMVNWNPQRISQAEYDALVATAKEEWTYAKANAEYIGSANGVLKMWKDDLPRIMEQKQKGATTEQIKQEADLRVESATAGFEAKKAEIQQNERASRLNNDFNAQMALQQQTAEIKNMRQTRVAWIAEIDPQGIIACVQDLVAQVMMHEKFKGIYALDQQGTYKGDIDGVPQYANWLQWLLDFAAAGVDSVPGVEFKMVAKTIQKGS